MSLAATGGAGAGMAGGGLSMSAMAHGGPNAGSIATQQPMHSHSGIPGGGHGTAAPGTSFFALGADLLDKNQSFLSGKNVRSAAKLPLVAVDIYGDKCDVAYFPPMEEDEDNGGDEMVAMVKAMAKVKAGVTARSCGGYGDNGTDVVLKKDDSGAYKAVKKYLTKGEGFGAVLDEAFTDASEKEGTIVMPRPHLLMGARKIGDLNAAAKAAFGDILPERDEDSSAMGPDDAKSLGITTIAMDGNSTPKGDDFDRVAFRLRLNSKKKVMTMLPEEALALVIASCRRKVKEGYEESQIDKDGLKEIDEEEEEEEYMDYPPAFAIPGWATSDAAVEALIDAAKGGVCGPSLHQRSVAACVGALLPPPTPEIYKKKASNGREVKSPSQPASKLMKLLTEVMQTKDKEAAQEAGRVAAMNREDPVEPDPFVPLIVLVGATKEGIELTAVLVSKPQGPDKELHCPFGNLSVVSSVCYAHADPLSLLEGSLDEIRERIGVHLPESEEPAAFVTYGSIGTQVKLAGALKAALTKYGTDGADDDDWDGWDHDVPIVSTREECASLGTAVLGAAAHGRVRIVEHKKSKDGKNRARARIGVAVQDVATCGVAVSYNYIGSGGEAGWTEPKVIFDFDRRVPAGPYRIDFTAAECAAHIRHCEKNKTDNRIEDEETLDGLVKALSGSKGIPQREAAGLKLKFRIFQRTARGGGNEWVRVGDDMRPLSMEHTQKGAGHGEESRVAIESAVLELNLSAVGLLSTSMVTNGETIVQATKSARNSKLLRYGTIIGSVLFIGGFLVKSYVEEKIFDRDTQKVMAYYKHAAPNSFHDGDERHARYMVWKYKGKKDRLWRRLETKYQVPMRDSWEWDDEEEVEKKEMDGEEAEDLDSGDGAENDGEEEL